MDIPKFLNDNLQLILSNPSTFIAFSILIFGIAWVFINFLYKRQIETLKTNLSLKDDQFKYGKKLLETEQATPKSVIENNTTQQSANNLKEEILQEIQFLKQHAGRALSMKLFERLQPKYDFIVILTELFTMNKNNELKWSEAPDPPAALSEIIIVNK